MIARTKQRMGAASRIGDRERFQFELGRFDAALRSARSFVYEWFGETQVELDRGDDLAPADSCGCVKRPHMRPTSRST